MNSVIGALVLYPVEVERKQEHVQYYLRLKTEERNVKVKQKNVSHAITTLVRLIAYGESSKNGLLARKLVEVERNQEQDQNYKKQRVMEHLVMAMQLKRRHVL